MNSKDKASFKIKRVIYELKKALDEKDSKVLAFCSPQQLSNFITKFESILQMIMMNNIPTKNERVLGIANLVADQWSYDLELGIILIDAEQAYIEI
ncbi:hypothetical protein [Rosenbergiella epipactidis]|uniref:hypothetical protein n=1 Tax=Rosenbergiella epipactidis TaxID=1544694 RepID=UPI001F4E65E0|nr:hypothetical protein [Rosenbergiella epipactidis]